MRESELLADEKNKSGVVFEGIVMKKYEYSSFEVFVYWTASIVCCVVTATVSAIYGTGLLFVVPCAES